MLASMEACVTQPSAEARMKHASRFRARNHGAHRARQALVAHDGFSARYDLDRIAEFLAPGHKLAASPMSENICWTPPKAAWRRLDAARDAIASIVPLLWCSIR